MRAAPVASAHGRALSRVPWCGSALAVWFSFGRVSSGGQATQPLGFLPLSTPLRSLVRLAFSAAFAACPVSTLRWRGPPWRWGRPHSYRHGEDALIEVSGDV